MTSNLNVSISLVIVGFNNNGLDNIIDVEGVKN